MGTMEYSLTSLQDHGHALSIGSTSRDQRQLTVLVMETVGGVREDPDPSRPEGMTDRHGPSPGVELLLRDLTQRTSQSQFVSAECLARQGLQIAENLPGEGLVEFDHVEV